MNLKSLVLSLAVAASLSPALQAGNVIVNGSLETSNTAITPIVNTYVAGTIPGWTVQGASVGAPFNAVYDSPLFLAPYRYTCQLRSIPARLHWDLSLALRARTPTAPATLSTSMAILISPQPSAN